MDNKGVNGEGLARLWDKIKSTFVTEQYVQNAIAEIGSGGSENVDCKILKVTADAVFTSETGGMLSGMSHSFEEVQNAYDEGYLIYFCIDASQVDAGTIFVMPLCIIKHNSHMSCTTILDMSGTLMYIQFFLLPSGGSFSLKAI